MCASTHALVLLLHLHINLDTHLCLCSSFHACGCVFISHIKPICIHVLLPFKAFIHLRVYCVSSGLQLCASSWVAQPSPGSPYHCLLFIMHGWSAAGTEHFITTVYGEKQRQMGRQAQGSRRPSLQWDIP